MTSIESRELLNLIKVTCQLETAAALSQRGYVISAICGPSVETLDPDITICVVVDSLTCEASKHECDDYALVVAF